MLEYKFRKNANNNDGFHDYLKTSKSDLFVLDLNNCTLIECIDKMCDIKSLSHPRIKQNYRMLINKIIDVKERFNCKIMPARFLQYLTRFRIFIISKSGKRIIQFQGKESNENAQE